MRGTRTNGRGRPEGRANPLASGHRARSAGRIFALVGPDGSGKSTHAKRIAARLQPRYRTKVMYLGANINGWIKWRRALRMIRPTKRRPGIADERSRPKRFKQHKSSPTRLLLEAAMRWAAVRKAARLRRKGVVIICDRWPQTLAAGHLDGPSEMPGKGGVLARLVNRVEWKLYSRMVSTTPDKIIHLMIDYETSAARKPGDIDRAEFARWDDMMAEMRKIDPAIDAVDAKQDKDEVTDEALALVEACLPEPEQS